MPLCWFLYVFFFSVIGHCIYYITFSSFLGALRFMRKIIGLKDEFYNRYIIGGNLFQPVVDAFRRNNGRYNLLDSAIIEMFEFIKLVSVFCVIIVLLACITMYVCVSVCIYIMRPLKVFIHLKKVRREHLGLIIFFWSNIFSQFRISNLNEMNHLNLFNINTHSNS